MNLSQPRMRDETGGHLIDVAKILSSTRRQWKFALAGFFLVFALAALYLHIAPQKYEVTMEITAVSDQTSSAGKLGALSSLAGIDLAGGGNPSFRVFLDSLQSPVAAEQLVKHQDLLIGMFPNEWSPEEKRWRQPPSLLRPIKNFVESVLGYPAVPWTPPSTYRVYKYVQSEVRLAQDPKSGVVTLQMESERPAFALKLLKTLNHDVDNLMRDRVIARTSGYIKYLESKLTTVTVSDYRASLIENLSEQEKTRMMASGGPSYASELLGDPVISNAPTSPPAIAILALAALTGAVVGVMWASMADRRKWKFLEFRKRTSSERNIRGSSNLAPDRL